MPEGVQWWSEERPLQEWTLKDLRKLHSANRLALATLAKTLHQLLELSGTVQNEAFRRKPVKVMVPFRPPLEDLADWLVDNHYGQEAVDREIARRARSAEL